MLYQRRWLATGEPIGAPAPLPADLVGLSDQGLASLATHLSPAAVHQLGYTGQAFYPVDTPPPSVGPVRIVKYWLLQRFSEDQERQFAKLEFQAKNLTPAQIDDPAFDPLFQLQRFLRRLDALSIVELDAVATLEGFELLRRLGVFGDPEAEESHDAVAVILAPPTGREIA